MYKLVASDMDETFLYNGHVIPAPNLGALARMRELGTLFVPCSGRAYNSIAKNLEDIDPDLLGETFIVSFNGGFINRYGDPRPLTTCSLGLERAEALYRHGKSIGACMHICEPDGTYHVFNPTQNEIDYLASYPTVHFYDAAEHEDLSFLHLDDVVKLLYMSDDFEGLRRLGAEEMEPFAQLLGDTDVTYSSNRYMEFMPAGVTKATGLKRLTEMLGIDMSEVIGLGDSANDIAMLDAAGLGVGVSNVTDDARPHCDVVLETSGFEGALPEVVTRFLER